MPAYNYSELIPQAIHSHLIRLLEILEPFYREAKENLDESIRAFKTFLREPFLTIGPSETSRPLVSNEVDPFLEFESYSFNNSFGSPDFLQGLNLSFVDYIRFLQYSLLELVQSIEALLAPFYSLIASVDKALIALAIMVFHPACLPSFLAGVATHLLLFNHGEWDRCAPKIAATFAAVEFISVILFFNFKGWSLVLFLQLSALYVSGILISALVYRVFFHPLHNFPGPLLARIGVLWRKPSFISVWDDHRQYGNFVRIGPREVSINDAAAFHQIHGPGSPCVKGPIYECTLERTLHCTREYPMLTERTTVWERSLDYKYCLKGYQAIIRNHCRDFVECLKSNGCSHPDITQLLRYFAYDVMGDITLGRSLDMVKSRKGHSAMLQEDFVQGFVGSFKCAPWLVTLLKKAPFVKQLRATWLDDCADLLEERFKAGQEREDFFSSLLSYAQATKNKPSSINHSLVRDADLAISTGTDTIAYTLSALIWLLATHPEKQKLLQDEVDHAPPGSPGFNFDYLKFGAPYLTGCINEALRLYPVVPGGIQRLTPPEGMTLAGRFIPGNTIVSTPIWTMHRDPRYFASPNDFLPERWITQPDLVRQLDAYVPFLTGPYRCPAQRFATLEICMLISWIVYEFDIWSYEENRTDGQNVICNPGPEEKFILRFPGYRVEFTPRKKPGTDERLHEMSPCFARSKRRQNDFIKRLERENRIYSKSAWAFRRSYLDREAPWPSTSYL